VRLQALNDLRGSVENIADLYPIVSAVVDHSD